MRFWKGISSSSVEHKEDAECIDRTRGKIAFKKQNTVRITKDEVTRKLKSLPDWKVAEPHKIQRFWLKLFTTVHEVLATALNEVSDVSGWFLEGRLLVTKYPKKGTEAGNYRPIACLKLIDMEAAYRNHE